MNKNKTIPTFSELFFCGRGGNRTPEGARPTDLQSAPFDRSGTRPGAACRI